MIEHTDIIMDRDLPTKSVQIFHWDEAKQQGIVQDVQDATDIIERNKRIGRGDPFNKKAMFRPVGSVPTNLYTDLKRQWDALGFTWRERQEAFRKWLNDSDNSVFKYDPSFRV